MPSPCYNLCRLDASGAACRDCGRTIDEIAGWGSLDVDAQTRIMAQLPGRLEAARQREAVTWQQQQQQQ